MMWFGDSMGYINYIYLYTRSVAEQSHLATSFFSSLHAKHIRNEVHHLLHTHQVTVLCSHY